MEKIAPIVIMTYSRIEHLKKVVKSLIACPESRYSELYVLLDAPKKGDEEIVGKVRDYVNNIKGFKKNTVLERKENNRLKNYIEGATYILEKHGKMIFLEDDNVVANNFLAFMNDGLNKYEDNKQILSICGFNVPANYPSYYKKGYYLSCYFNAWGFATWENRKHLNIELMKDAYIDIINDKKLLKKVNSYHPKLIDGLKRNYSMGFLAGDHNLTYYSIKNNVYSIKPIKSLVDNIGHDGSGLNCSTTDKFRNEIADFRKKIIFDDEIQYDQKIDFIYYKFFYPNLLSRIFRRLMRVLNDA